MSFCLCAGEKCDRRDYTGSHDGEVTFEVALESAGPVSFTVSA
jgi:predicted secreted protein